MKIRSTVKFQQKFYRQIDFIASDKPGAAKKFKTDVLLRIEEITKMPFKNKRSVYYNDDLIRELTFKGYTIIYKVDEINNEIVVFGFIKYQEKPE
jgi:plasmid stabilization system protein ParE